MKYFLLKRKKDGKFMGRNGNYIEITSPDGPAAGVFYPEKEAAEWGKVWSSVFEFIPIVQKNGYWLFT